MNSRERLQLVLRHQEPDRVPLDLGSPATTGIHLQAYRALRRFLGLPEIEPKIYNLLEQIAVVDQDVLDKLKVDARSVAPSLRDSFKFTFKIAPVSIFLL